MIKVCGVSILKIYWTLEQLRTNDFTTLGIKLADRDC